MRISITKCPTCGSENITGVKRDVCGQIRGRAYRAVEVEFYECPDCGEKVYDRQAMACIERARNAARRKQAHPAQSP
jgi:YgiT-type zinc finger domain-containing protein